MVQQRLAPGADRLMPAYLLKDAVGASAAPFPGKNGLPDFDWARLEEPFGRVLTTGEREQVVRILLFYSVRMSDDFQAPSVPAVLDALSAIEGAADDPVALDNLLRQPTASTALQHVRWELFWAPSAPAELPASWLHSLQAKRRRLQDRQDLRLYHHTRPDLIEVEGPDGVWKAVTIEPEVSLREMAFNGLVEGLDGVWRNAGLVVTVRKDDQKAKRFTPSPFTRFVEALLNHLPRAYRRQSTTALATAVSKVLQKPTTARKTKPDPPNPD
jgi:hypothetical protein